jgi:hypothetical protein
MNINIRIYSIFLFILSSLFSFSQTDTVTHRGTIKVGKEKGGKVYIKAFARYTDYDLSKLRDSDGNVSQDQFFQPFPVVHGYAYPFNYTRYFNENFKFKVVEVDLKGKKADTVFVEIKVLANGKVYVKDKSRTKLVNGVPAVYDEQVGAYELNSLHLNSLDLIKDIQQWIPGYVVLPKKAKFKKQVVIKPNKKNLDVTGTITIIFSSTPFDE